MKFKLRKNYEEARTGVIETQRGAINTPVFMPVGTQGSVKTASFTELKETGAQIILGNTYHLYLRPGDRIIKKMGGLHNFINWDRPILTDSGGYQVFSLGEGSRGEKLVKITNDGVEFKSHLDGKKHIFTPEGVIDIQINLGSDIMMPLDVCPSANAGKEEIAKAVRLTTNWFERAHNHYSKIKTSKGALFAIVQGGTHKNLRKESYLGLSKFSVDGFSIGGVANAGESKIKQKEALKITLPLLPEEKPRYLMGVGMPEDILYAVEMGVDMFDCVAPTRMARNGAVFTKWGRMNLFNSKYKTEVGPIEKGCTCYACKNHSKAYIRHLLVSGEILGIRLTTLHNLSFMSGLMLDIQQAIRDNNFSKFKKSFLTGYRK